jgi:hypothetical protein
VPAVVAAVDIMLTSAALEVDWRFEVVDGEGEDPRSSGRVRE